MSQSQDFSPQYTEVVVTEPALAGEVQVVESSSAELEFVAESEEPPSPLVPPHTADSEVLNPSTGQPPNKHQNEVAYNI